MLLARHREQFDQDINHRLERIQKNVEVETDLISELLELSRIKTRRQKMEMVETTVLVSDLQDIFEDDLRSRSISLLSDMRLPVLYGERSRFRQVLQNLIDNAIKYMGEGPTREIHVGCTLAKRKRSFTSGTPVWGLIRRIWARCSSFSAAARTPPAAGGRQGRWPVPV